MAKNRELGIGVVLRGDSKGAVKAVKLTEEQIRELDKTSQTTSDKFKASAAKIGSGFGSMATQAAKWGAAVGLAATAATAALVKSGLQTADSLAKQSDKLGVSTEALAKFRFAAEQTGVAQNKADVALQRFTRRLADAAAGTGPAVQAFDSLGLSADELIKLSPDQAFARVAEQMNKVENQSQKVSLAFKLFDSEGVDLVRTLALGREGMEQLGTEADILGLTMSRFDAAKVEQANDAMNRISKAVQGFSQHLAVKFAPILQWVADAMFGVAKEAGGMGNVAGKAFDYMVKGIGLVADAWAGLKIAWWGITAVASDAAAFVLESLDTMLRGVSDLWAKLPWADENGFYDNQLAQWAEGLRGYAQDGYEKMYAVLSQKLPSEQLAEFTAEVVRQSDIQAAAAVDAQKEIQGEVITTADVSEAMTKKTTKVVEDEWTKALEGTVNRIDEAFASAWKGSLDSFSDFADGIKDAFKNLLAEMAHLAITRPVIMQIGAAFGLGSATSAASAATSAGGALSGAGGIMGAINGGMGGLMGSISGAYGGLSNIAGSLGFDSLAQGFGTQATIFNNAGWGQGLAYGAVGLGAGLAGNFLGNAIFGDSKYGSTGATIGGIVGSAFGPLGTLAGSFIGNGLGSLFGNNAADLTRSTVNLNTGQYIRRDNRGHDMDEGARGVGDILLALGRAVGATGSLDFSLHGEQGFRLGTGAGRQTFGQDTNAFIQAAFEQMVNSSESLSDTMRRLMLDFNGTTNQTLRFATAMGAVGVLLEQNPVEQAMADFADAQEDAGKTLTDRYRKQVGAIASLANGFDGSAAAAENLAARMQENQAAAYELAMAIQAISEQTAATLAESAKYFRQSQLSEEEMLKLMQLQRRQAFEDLQVATDPEQVADLAAEWNRLNREIFDALDPEAQANNADAYAKATDFVAKITDAKFNASLDDLGTTADSLNASIESLLAAQNDNTTRDETSSRLFAEAVNRLVTEGIAITTNVPAFNA